MTELQSNVLYYGDNLDILRRYIPDASVDLIYLDPPFNSNRDYNVIFRDESGNRSDAQLLAFEDTWHWGPSAEHDLPIPDEHGPPRGPRAGQGQHHHRGAALRDRREPDDGLPGRDGRPPRRAASRPEADRLALPPLRPHGEPLPEAGPRCDFRTDRISGTRSSGAALERTAARRSFGPIHDTLLFYAKTDAYSGSRQRPYMLGHAERRYKADESGRMKFTSGGNILTGAGTTRRVWATLEGLRSHREEPPLGYPEFRS